MSQKTLDFLNEEMERLINEGKLAEIISLDEYRKGLLRAQFRYIIDVALEALNADERT